jgi:hypothetical protein
MYRRRISQLAVCLIALAACAEGPTAPVALEPSPGPLYADVVYEDNGGFHFTAADPASSCALDAVSTIQGDTKCKFKIVEDDNAGRTSIDLLRIRLLWIADVRCVHTKTGKPAPARKQTSSPRQVPWEWEGAVGLTEGAFEANWVFYFSDAAFHANPCAGKGAYTRAEWSDVVLHRFALLALDGVPGDPNAIYALVEGP